MPIAVIVSLIIFQVLMVFIHLAIYATASAAFGIGSLPLEIVFVVLSVTFFTASILSHTRKGTLVDWYYRFAAYWFGLAMFLFGGGVMFFFVASISYYFNYYIPPEILGGIFFGGWFLLHLYATWNSWRAEITKISVTLSGIPDAWRGKKIVFLSDVHLGNIRQESFAEKVVRKVKALSPEVVLIGGDMYDGGKCDVEAIVEPFRSLHAPRGVYFVTGNHEYYLPGGPEVAVAALRGVGMKILNNEKVDLGGITLVGVDDKAAGKREDFKHILEDVHIPKNAPVILLKHQPTNLDVARDAGIALGFFGHTHRGQIFPLNYITRRIYKGFDYGLKRLQGLQVYTSSGVGSWGPPMRLGTKSEIVLIELS